MLHAVITYRYAALARAPLGLSAPIPPTPPTLHILRMAGRPCTSGTPAGPSSARPTPHSPQHAIHGRPADGGWPRAPGQRELRDDVRRRLGSAGCADGDLRLIRQGPRAAVLQRPGARAAAPRPRLAPAPGRADSQPKAALGARAGPHAVGALCAGTGHARRAAAVWSTPGPCAHRPGPTGCAG